MTNKRATSKRTKETLNDFDLDSSILTNTLSNVKIDIKHKNETQKKLTTSIKNNDVIICTGPAGCGKTFISCAQSLLELKQNENIKKIVLVKSVTTLKNEELGFLKGTLEEKMEPFIYSFMNNFEKIIGKETLRMLKTSNFIEVLPIAYMRGINIDNAIVIIDEVQNISVDNIKTILTRLGENSKMILLGDLKQTDLKHKDDNALKFLSDNFNNIHHVSVVNFNINDVVRHKLIPIIEPIFDRYQQKEKRVKK